ncbi:MAG: hypothetical protein KAS30_03860 [Candidatus Diapherotrites archaeon]|nr:hypothetical protein [Candidatus Diapherotrites archaeon]
MSLPVIHLDRPNQFAFTGWSGEAVNFAGLPSAATVDGQFWMVLNASGSRFLFTYKASGLYLSESGAWRKINNAQLLLNDDQFSVYNAIDNTKQITFDVSAIATATKRTATWPNKDGVVAFTSDIVDLKFNVDLDSAESSVTRVVAGGRTTFTVTHGLNTLDIQAQVFRLSDGRTIGWRVERTGVNTVEVSRNGNIADGLFRLVI